MNIKDAFRAAYDTVSGKSVRDARSSLDSALESYNKLKGKQEHFSDMARLHDVVDNPDMQRKLDQNSFVAKTISDHMLKTEPLVQDAKDALSLAEKNQMLARAGLTGVGGAGLVGGTYAMSNKEAMWKKDYSEERRQDALLFIKEAFSKNANSRSKKEKDKKSRNYAIGATAGVITPSLAYNLGDDISSMGAKGLNPQHVKAVMKHMSERDTAAFFGTPTNYKGVDVSNAPQAIKDKVKELEGRGIKFHSGIDDEVIEPLRDQAAKQLEARKILNPSSVEGMDVDDIMRDYKRQLAIENFGGGVFLDLGNGNQKLVAVDGLPEAVLAHEMGHADASNIFTKAVRKAGMIGQGFNRQTKGILSPSVAGIGGLYSGLSSKTDEERDKALRNTQIATAIAGTPEILSAVEEGRANVNALMLGRKAGKGMEYAKDLLPAYTTYLGQAAKPLIGVGALGLARMYKKKRKKQTEKTAMAGKLIGGGAILGGLGLGYNEYSKSKVNPMSGLTYREAARQAREAQDAKFSELTGKKRNPLVRAAEKKLEELGQKMDEKPNVAVPVVAAMGATAGGLGAYNAVDFIKRNARLI